MGAYKAAIVTQGGQNLIAQALAENKTLTFTSAKTSVHSYPVGTNITALTGLQDIVQSVQVSNSKVLNNTTVQISVRFDNDGVTQQYQINTIGVYAQPEGGEEILFAVIQAITPDEMPVQSDVSPSAFIYNIQFAVRNASQITLMINPAGVATLQDILDVRQEIIDIAIPEFEDYSFEGVKVPDTREAIANIKSETGLKAIFSNVKAALMGLVTIGEMRGLLVNHGLCTEPGKFFLDAAYGKYLTDQITQLNSDKQSNITGAASTITKNNLAANRVLISDQNGKLVASSITNIQLGYLNGITSNIQTQLNNLSTNNAKLRKYTSPMITLKNLNWITSYGGKKYATCGISESSLNGQIVSFYMEEFGNWQSGLNMMLDLRNGVLEIMCNDTSILHANNDTGAVSIVKITVWYHANN